MSREDDFLLNFDDLTIDELLSLSHYASPYYDPVKAHEYYMRTRQLKGRSYSKLSEEGKDAWAYVNDTLTEKKKAEIEDEKKKRDETIERHREEAKEARERISEKLKKLNEALSERAAREKEAIKNGTFTQKKDYTFYSPTAPGGRYSNQHKTVADVTAETKAEREKNRAEASTERKQVAENLKQVISATREAFKAAKTNIDTKYETLFQEEYDRIASEYPKQ